MKIGKITIRRTYKLSRLICDLISLAETAVIVYMTVNFINIEDIESRAVALSMIFPSLVLIIAAVYVFLTLKNLKFGKYEITKKNAEEIYNWYAFSVSLVKLPALLIVFESMLTFQEIMLGIGVNLLNFRIILYILLIVIIIRMSIHRISMLAKKEETSDAVIVRSVAVDDEKEKK